MIREQRIKLVREEGVSYGESTKLTNACHAVPIGRAYIEANYPDREMCIALILDSKNVMTGIYTISIGSLNASIVHPRETFKAAILANAAAIIMMHNHPSGDPTPSREDFELSRRMREAGDLLGIRFLDHIVIGDASYYSMADRGDI